MKARLAALLPRPRRSTPRACRPSWLAALCVAVIASVMLLARGVGAQDARPVPLEPITDAPVVAADAAIPGLPEGFEQIDDGDVRWESPVPARFEVERLRPIVTREWPRVRSELGDAIDGMLTIRVGRDPEEMARLAPPSAPPPEYAVGVAYPALGLVVLTLTSPATWEPPPLDRVVVHELSHIALHRATRAQPVPRWFAEGLAIHQADERDMERVRTLWEATVRGRLLRLDDLSHRFPPRPHQASLAYAESADFVAWLYDRGGEGGPRQVRDMITRISHGQRFETAISQTWSLGLGQLEEEWRTEVGERYGALPLLLSSGLVSILIVTLVVAAWARRKRRAREVLARWAEEEQAADERAQQIAARAAALRELVAARADRRDVEDEDDADDDDEAPVERIHSDAPRPDGGARPTDGAIASDTALSMPPPRRDGETVPTIVWEGRNHTLH